MVGRLSSHKAVGAPGLEHDVGSFPSRPAQKVIGHLSNKWNVLVIRRLFRRTMRYSELRRDIGDIAQKMLTQTLRHLERIGLVSRKVYPVVPPKVEYSKTELGVSCAEAVDGLVNWAVENIDRVETRLTFTTIVKKTFNRQQWRSLMSRIEMVDPDKISGDIEKMFEAVTAMMGRVPNSYRVLARVPMVSKLLLPFNAAMQREGAGSRLSSKLYEMVVIKTSHVNACNY